MHPERPATLIARAAWAHDLNSDRIATATFQSLPGASFIVNGASAASNAALASIGARVSLGHGWTLVGQLDGEDSSSWHSVAGTATIRKVW